jgi:hypothetical protein
VYRGCVPQAWPRLGRGRLSAPCTACSSPAGRTSGRRRNSPGKDMTICGGHSTTQPLSPIETNKSAVASLARPVHACESPPSCDRFYCVRCGYSANTVAKTFNHLLHILITSVGMGCGLFVMKWTQLTWPFLAQRQMDNVIYSLANFQRFWIP